MMTFALGIKDPFDVTFNARMTPIRANIVGPPFFAMRISASMATCHSGAECSAFDSFVMWLAASLKVRSCRPFGSGIGSSNGVDQGNKILGR